MNNIIKILNIEFKNFNNYLSKHLHLLLCFFLILITINFIVFERPVKKKEGFDIKEVERVTPKVVIGKLKSFFGQIKNILKLIRDKITNLPNCIPAYMIYRIINGISTFLRSFLPSFLMKILDFVYKYTIDLIFKWTGINSWLDSCASFKVDDEVDNMDDEVDNMD
jgi:hypothetical protein